MNLMQSVLNIITADNEQNSAAIVESCTYYSLFEFCYKTRIYYSFQQPD